MARVREECRASRQTGRGARGYLNPVYWSDNYFSLLPGESRSLTAELPAAAGPLAVALDGWNITPVSLELR